MVYIPGAVETLADVLWVDRKGVEVKIGVPRKAYSTIRLSPDGKKLALTATDGDQDIWIWDLERNMPSRLTSGPGIDQLPLWMPDSRQIIYRSDSGGNSDIYRRLVDGTGPVEQLTHTIDLEAPYGVLKGGELLIATTPPGKPPYIAALGLGRDAKPVPLGPGTGTISFNAAVSPDGRWIAYESPEGSTRNEIHVRPYPDSGSGHWQISTDGGSRPMFSRSGGELLYRTPGPSFRIMSAKNLSIPGRAEFVYQTPVQVLDASKYRFPSSARSFDTSLDDQRFLMLAPVSDTSKTPARPTIRIVTNWVDELRARLKK